MAGRLATPGQPVNHFDPDLDPDAANVLGDQSPEPPARYVAPADLLIDWLDLGNGVQTLIGKGDEIGPDLLGYPMRRADNGRRVKFNRA